MFAFPYQLADLSHSCSIRWISSVNRFWTSQVKPLYLSDSYRRAGFCLRLEVKNETHSAHEIKIGANVSWNETLQKHVDDSKIETLLNTNLFFAFFYASSRTVDTEDLCMMTSRSTRYYASAAYWDRDSLLLLWAFPAIVETNPVYILFVFIDFQP